jgi:hypothetical protein
MVTIRALVIIGFVLVSSVTVTTFPRSGGAGSGVDPRRLGGMNAELLNLFIGARGRVFLRSSSSDREGFSA